MTQGNKSMEEYIEELYWEFDAEKGGYGEYKDHPQSERDAFKHMMRKMYNYYIKNTDKKYNLQE